MDLPQILVISTKKGKSGEIAESIGAKRSPQTDSVVVDYLWDIDNKYYTSQVLIRTVDLCVPNNLPVEGVNALIVYHDLDTPDDPESVDRELKHLASILPALTTAEILLFCCGAISDEYLVREKLVNWCLCNKFELVELQQTGDSESDTEGNKYGIERIVEALHAHIWPNIVLKDKPGTEETSKLDEIEEQFENIRLTRDPAERLQMQHMLDGIMGDENADFGELFGQLMAMKEHAASLPTNARRRVAEQVVTAFWKAIGGDHLEIDD
ncbi:hypothetical protein DMN91_012952 [Ooceraea biroi]|uniref:Alpha-and gamma-adaptin-binding protein p34 n=1 Tax=Ooceraea biroi TaxID=2015173 RepID=A0A3L8D3I3_OOCBI|nr:alpha- and gamma-adaptin-binding protein p34 [Ooceraea biroi]RLU15065.1 hypothetical protein DMN91_012952 [Ooceraea biroi]